MSVYVRVIVCVCVCVCVFGLPCSQHTPASDFPKLLDLGWGQDRGNSLNRYKDHHTKRDNNKI